MSRPSGMSHTGLSQESLCHVDLRTRGREVIDLGGRVFVEGMGGTVREGRSGGVVVVVGRGVTVGGVGGV